MQIRGGRQTERGERERDGLKLNTEKKRQRGEEKVNTAQIHVSNDSDDNEKSDIKLYTLH